MTDRSLSRRFAAAFLAATIVVSSAAAPARAADEDVTGQIFLEIGDDFADREERIRYDVRDESDGKFYRVRFQGLAAQRRFEPGERVKLLGARRLSATVLQVTDNLPSHVIRLERADLQQNFGPVEPVDYPEPLDPPRTFRLQSGPAQAPPVPSYSSNPAATAKLFLDFDGNTEATWGGRTNVVTPAFDRDGDPATFSAGELSDIEEIWRRVSENFSPFNIDVTTVDPGNRSERVTAAIAIGGSSSDWYGASAGGVAYIGGFYSFSSNTGYVFEDNLGNGHPPYVATAAAHEAGHLFGLGHQAEWNGTTLVSSYYAGTGNWAPIMGVGYYRAQDIWHNGATPACSTCFQDDLAALSNAFNNFGYRADPHGNTTGAAFALGGTVYNQAGIIERNTDADVFQLTMIDAGTLTLTAAVATLQPMLDAVLTLRDSGGAAIATDSPGASFSAGFTGAVPAGVYHAEVTGTGVYGHIGSYALTGNFVASGGANLAPTANAQSRSTNEDTATAITLTGSDANGDPLTFAIVAPPANGTLTGAAPNVTYIPTANYSGPDAFTFRVNDGLVNSAAATVTLTVAPVNDAPVATPQTLSSTGFGISITLAGSDAELSSLTYTVVAAPAQGTLSGTAPNLTYVPAAYYSGADAFTFKVNDGALDSAAATVSLTVAGDAPPPGNTPSATLRVERNVMRPGQGQAASMDLGTEAGTTDVQVRVVNQSGETVREFSQDVRPGASRVTWDGRNDAGEPVRSGSYYMYLRYASRKVTQPVVVLR